MMRSLNHNLSPLAQTMRGRGLELAGSRRQLSPGDQALLRQILQGKYEFVKSELFGRGGAYHKLFEQPQTVQKPDINWYHPVMETFGEDAGRTRSKPIATVLLTAAQERVLFLQFNYCRYRVCKLKEKIGAGPVRSKAAMEILHWHHQAQLLRDQIAQTNLALVLAMAKRTRMSDVEFSDLVSEGNMALLRAVDKFDVGRGFKFSTYGCRAILKAFSRVGVKFSKYRNMFPTDFDPALERSDNLQTKRAQVEDDCADEVKQIIRENRAELTDVEQEVISHRFAIDPLGKMSPDSPTLTLAQVGQIIGVTKERVRQIQNKALTKIRQSLQAEYLG